MAGPLGLDERGDAKFLGRWPRLLELLALWAETQQLRIGSNRPEKRSELLFQIHILTQLC